MKTISCFYFAMLVGIASVNLAHSADLDTSNRRHLEPIGSVSPSWHFSITPYAWAPAFKGDVTARGRNFDVDASISDVLSALDFAAFGYLEARRGRFGLYTDLIYGDFSLSRSTVRQINPIANLSLSVGVEAGLEYKLTLIDAGMFYRIVDNTRHLACIEPDQVTCGGGTSVDLMAGVRYAHQEANVDLSIVGVVDLPALGLTREGTLARAATGTIETMDPIIGARVIQTLDSRQSIDVRGDIGGFGISSDLTWQALAVYNYKFHRRNFDVVGQLGYRALGIDVSENAATGRRGVDYVIHGPVVGIKFQW